VCVDVPSLLLQIAPKVGLEHFLPKMAMRKPSLVRPAQVIGARVKTDASKAIVKKSAVENGSVHLLFPLDEQHEFVNLWMPERRTVTIAVPLITT
jgi:hypothetical protein